MQPLTWYFHRFRSMPADELWWRMRSVLRDESEKVFSALGLDFHLPAALTERELKDAGPPGFRVTDVEAGEWARPGGGEREAEWCRRLIERAEPLLLHRFTLFGLSARNLGDPIDWNRDHESERQAPMRFAPSIDYRDVRSAGDAKLVWEPNRHHHLVVLGRAFRASGDQRYATEVVRQIESWIEQCPFGLGMNWRSPLELAIRMINWVWAIDLIRDSDIVTEDFLARLLGVVRLHLWEVTRKYSQGSSANNHVIGEAAGVFIAASYFRGLSGATRWRKEARDILAREIVVQTYRDGFNREQAMGYHLFVTQFFLVAGIVARISGPDFPSEYWSRLEKMLEFVGILSEGGSSLPMFGDGDDGYVLDVGKSPADAGVLLSVGSALFGRRDMKSWAGEYSEPVRWLLGRPGMSRFDAITPQTTDELLSSYAFPESGIYLLQCGRRGSGDCVSVLFDCAELGYKSIAAHGHADALSFTLRAFGVDVFVDPGTYDYFTFPEWRNYFRGTRAHNTLVIDNTDQSVMLGPFLWGEKANARCVRWTPRSGGGTVVAEHDGYRRLPDPVLHRRTIDLDGKSRTLTIQDEIGAKASHDVEVYFHLSEDCSLSKLEPNRCVIAVGRKIVELEVDPSLSVRLLTGSENPIGGWVSRRYHHKSSATTIVCRGSIRGSATLLHRVTIGESD